MKRYSTADLPPYPKDTPPTDDAIAEWLAPIVKVSPRTVEAWPITYKKVLGKRVRDWDSVGAYVVGLLNNAPLYRGGRRRTPIAPEPNMAASKQDVRRPCLPHAGRRAPALCQAGTARRDGKDIRLEPEAADSPETAGR